MARYDTQTIIKLIMLLIEEKEIKKPLKELSELKEQLKRLLNFIPNEF